MIDKGFKVMGMDSVANRVEWISASEATKQPQLCYMYPKSRILQIAFSQHNKYFIMLGSRLKEKPT